MGLLITILDLFFNVCTIVVLLQVAVSWLIMFDIINTGNAAARNLVALLHRLTDPVYSRLRRFIPPIGGIDLTPLVVMIGLSFARQVIIGMLLGL